MDSSKISDQKHTLLFICYIYFVVLLRYFTCIKIRIKWTQHKDKYIILRKHTRWLPYTGAVVDVERRHFLHI